MIQIDIRGLETVQQFLEDQPKRTTKALKLAVNSAALWGARQAKQEILRQVNFRSAYFGNPADSDAPLHVGKKATENNLTTEVVARARPTSLARFSASPVSFGKQSAAVKVRVRRGKTSTFKRAFFFKLKKGAALTQDNYNVGIAIRLKPDEELDNKKTSTVKMRNGLTLLYGPSIEQLFNTVSVDISDDVLKYAEREFLRQFVRLSND